MLSTAEGANNDETTVATTATTDGGNSKTGKLVFFLGEDAGLICRIPKGLIQ